jgi:hypothetical protein
MKKIRLDEWLKREFYPPPAIRTARLWIKASKIYPPPVKAGRSYYIEERNVRGWQDSALSRRARDG